MPILWQEMFAGRTGRIIGSQIRQFFSLTEQPDVISFAGGFPGSDLFPKEDIARTLAKVVIEEERSALQYSPTEGNYELRTYLAGKMRRENIPCEVEEIVVIDGAQQGIDLLFRILVNPGEPILVEEPAYIGGMGAIQSYAGIPVGIPMDPDGVNPELMAAALKKLHQEGKTPKLFYTVPNFQNPTGYTTSLQRRLEILALASRYNFLIVEDNPYGEICYEGAVPASYKSLDREGRVIYLGSYSKTLLPGIRIGWMVAPAQLLEKIVLAKQTTDLCSSSLGQRLAYRLSLEGYVDRHVKKLVAFYRQKRDTMISGIEQLFPPQIGFTRPKGGFFIWITFPGHFPPSDKLLMLALERKVAFVHGRGFCNSDSGSHSARFSFSQQRIEDIREGTRRLGDLFCEIHKSCLLKKTAPS